MTTRGVLYVHAATSALCPHIEWAVAGALGMQATSQVPDMRNCIVVIDSTGTIVEAWTQWDHLFQDGRGPHQIIMSPYDPERHVWVVDDMRHQMFKFSNDGKTDRKSVV